jgi:hypothetical protein
MYPYMTGKDFYDYIKGGLYVMVTEEAWLKTYEQYKNDDKGHWYFSKCDIANFPDPSDEMGFLKANYQFGVDHPPVYVRANEAAPTIPVPPELLRDVAIKNLYLPPPTLDWNPKRQGNHGTLVNLETWFWLDNPPPKTLTVHAAAGGNEATVNVTFDGMDIIATGELPKSCPGTGTPYTPGAHDPTCSLRFGRASSALGVDATTVTVKTTWTGTWEATGADPRPVAPLLPQPSPVSSKENIVVDEVQTLVTRPIAS